MHDRPDESNDRTKAPETLDLGNLQEVAVWLADLIVAGGAAGVTGVIGNAAYDTLKSIKRRFGRSRVRELEERVYQELRRVKRKPGVADRDLRNRAAEIFRDYESH